MPSEDRGLVAITGANGTIGYACVVYALNAGYKVRCVVRREAAIATIKSGPSVQQYLDKIEYTVVPDNTTVNAYDAAIRGADYVIHIAGAWPMAHLHPDNDIYFPFMKSMKNMLQACEHAGTVKRIVFTQAAAGLVDSEDGDTLGTNMDKVLDEHTQVNEACLSYKPPLKSAHNAYCSSKAQCMTYLNDLRCSNTLPYSIVQIIPGTVIGVSEFATTPARARGQMDRQTQALLFDEMRPRYAFGFVHLQDCAKVHVEALDQGKVKTEDVPQWFIAAASTPEGFDGERTWSEAIGMVESEFEREIAAGVFKLGRGKMPINMPYRVDSSFTEKILLDGRKIRGFEESVEEVARWFIGLNSSVEGLQS